MSGSMRGRRKRAATYRACVLLYDQMRRRLDPQVDVLGQRQGPLPRMFR
jgi:hypothetical protein